MSGVPGRGGPVPKRSDQRRRANKPAIPVDSGAAAAQVQRPEPDEDWHPIARRWFLALGESGQSAWYEPSDWATAEYVAEAMSRNLKAGKFSAQLFASVIAASTALLATEGDRRRLRIELERAKEGDGAEADGVVTELEHYRHRTSAG